LRRTVALAGSLLAAGALCAGALAACSREGEKEPVAKEETQSVIRFVAAEYSTESKPFLEGLVREFELKHPDILVELQVANWNVLDGIYTSMISKNQPPDLLITNVYAHFAQAGILNDLNRMVSPELKRKMYPNLLRMDQIDGVQYALPYVATIRSLYYNKELFREAGIARPPATWDELRDDARKIKATGKASGFGVDLTDDEIQAYLSYFFFGAGGGWIRDGKWIINSPENVEGLTYLKQLFDEGLTDPQPTVTTRDEKQRIVGDGKLGMMISGNYFGRVVPREFPELQWASGPIPVKRGVPPITFGVQDVLVSFRTDHTDAAALSAFLDFLYDDRNYEEMTTREGFIPVTSTVGDKLSREHPDMRRDIEALGTARFYPIQQPAWQAVMDTSRKMGDAILYNDLSPQAALDQLQAFAERRSSQ